jgi:serine/threonine protein phosphatase PrpC
VTNNSLWIIGAASVRGTGHVKIELPNQDAYEVASSRDGSSIAAVVSDGAGSAPHAEKGAKACVKIMARCLLDIAENHCDAIAGALNLNPRGQQLLQERVTRGLQEVRNSLDPTGQRLQDYHHTFTGTVLTPTGGFIVQIGDSPAIITRAETALDISGKHREVDFFAKHEIHMPEKGEYANETSFVTQPDWLASLRFFPFHCDNHRAVLLMSDGTGELAISKGQAFRPFIGTLIHQMLKAHSQQERDQVLHENLSHPQADELTADDKTLVILYHRDWLNLSALPHTVKSDLDESPNVQEASWDQHPPPPEKHKNSVRLAFLTFVLGIVIASAFFLTPWETVQRTPKINTEPAHDPIIKPKSTPIANPSPASHPKITASQQSPSQSQTAINKSGQK